MSHVTARLALEDGTVVRGRSFGALAEDPEAALHGQGAGEVVFNTALSGYEEVVTDPSYRGQIVLMTAPEMGNVGWNRDDEESDQLALSGFVVRALSPVASNWRSEATLDDKLRQAGVPGIAGVDTRALTRKLRDQGAMRGIVTTCAERSLSDRALVELVRRCPSMEGRNLVSEVTSRMVSVWREPSHPLAQAAPPRPLDRRIVAYDFGIKRNILRRLVDEGFEVTVVPAQTPAAEVLALRPDGIFLSNGPGDPATVLSAIEATRAFVEVGLPLFGICLGHQILGLALGASTYKLKFGHHGANQPVLDRDTGRVEITSQNHGFCVDVDSVAGRVELTHINLNDQTVEGMRVVGRPAFSVQYHPEAAPGPHDASYLFKRFRRLVDDHRGEC